MLAPAGARITILFAPNASDGVPTPAAHPCWRPTMRSAASGPTTRRPGTRPLLRLQCTAASPLTTFGPERLSCQLVPQWTFRKTYGRLCAFVLLLRAAVAAPPLPARHSRLAPDTTAQPRPRACAPPLDDYAGRLEAPHGSQHHHFAPHHTIWAVFHHQPEEQRRGLAARVPLSHRRGHLQATGQLVRQGFKPPDLLLCIRSWMGLVLPAGRRPRPPSVSSRCGAARPSVIRSSSTG